MQRPHFTRQVTERGTNVYRGEELLAAFPGTRKDPQGVARAAAFLKVLGGYYVKRRETGEMIAPIDPECQYRRATVLETPEGAIVIVTGGRKVPMPGLVQRMGEEGADGFFSTRVYRAQRKATDLSLDLDHPVDIGHLASLEDEAGVEQADSRHEEVVARMSESLLLSEQEAPRARLPEPAPSPDRIFYTHLSSELPANRQMAAMVATPSDEESKRWK